MDPRGIILGLIAWFLNVVTLGGACSFDDEFGGTQTTAAIVAGVLRLPVVQCAQFFNNATFVNNTFNSTNTTTNETEPITNTTRIDNFECISYKLRGDAGLGWAQFCLILAMLCGLPAVTMMIMMYNERLRPFRHLFYYKVLQWLFTFNVILVSFAFTLQDPFRPPYIWWPFYINWATWISYVFVLRRVTIDKYRIYSIWWYW